MRDTRIRSAFLLLFSSLLLMACGVVTPSAAPADDPVVISSKSFTESYLLAEMYAQLLESNGIPVERKPGLGFETELHAAMRAELIDLYPEYTSTGLLAVLAEPALQGEEEIYEEVKRQYEAQFGFVWLERSAFNNTWALATTQEIADRYNLSRISQLPALASQLRIGGEDSFFERDDGMPGLEEIYGRMLFADQVSIAAAERYQALSNGEIDLVVAYGTDGEIVGNNLRLLQDDKEFWLPYNAAPVVRGEVLESYPTLADILNPLAPLLTQETMTRLTWQVDGPEKLSHEEAARAFLLANHLLPTSQQELAAP